MKYISLFSGIGGFDLGFDRAGMTCVAQVEIDKACRSVLGRTWNPLPRFGDVTKFARRLYDCEQVDEDYFVCPRCSAGQNHDVEFSECDCVGTDVILDEVLDYQRHWIVGGFPCQDISAARDRWGAAGIKGQRSSLFYEYIRIVSELDPDGFVIENTGRLRNGRNGEDLRAIVEEIERLNYGWVGFVLDAAAFDCPARRPRVIIMALKPERGAGSFSAAQRLADCILCNDPGFVVLEGGGQSLTTDNGAARPGSGSHRKLTPLECERMMGFPDNWTGGQSNTARYKQLGNSVAVPVAEWIGKRIMELTRPPQAAADAETRETA